MNKLIRDGRVAVLISGDYGAGWSTWNPQYPEILFDPAIAQMVLDWERNSQVLRGDAYEAAYDAYYQAVYNYASRTYPDVYTGGTPGLHVEWVEEGEQFRVSEYDGSETLMLASNEKWITA